MDAFHIRTGGLRDSARVAQVENAVSAVDGVFAVMCVKSLGITSVVYEPLTVDRETIVRSIADAGFPAEAVTFSKSGQTVGTPGAA
jgi:copper chaperone CopZ